MKYVVECYGDEVIVRILMRLRIGDLAHEAAGRAEVLKHVRDKGGCGMVDEDPRDTAPTVRLAKHLAGATISFEDHANNLQVLDLPRGKARSPARSIVVLQPRMEEWILRVAKLARLKPRDYGLPQTAADLREWTATSNPRKLAKFEDFVRALTQKAPHAIQALKVALQQPASLRKPSP